MNERFVAVSTVTGSRICGCFSKPRCDLAVTSVVFSHITVARFCTVFMALPAAVGRISTGSMFSGMLNG